MALTEEYVQKKLKDGLDATDVIVKDFSNQCGVNFNVIVVTEKFIGVPILQRHRMVNEVLEADMPRIHAFTMKTLTPDQWEEEKH